MSTTEVQSTEKSVKDFERSWRYKTGLFLIVVGHIGMLVLLPALTMMGVGATTASVLFIVSEAMTLSSIFFLGKEGFKAIKAKFTGAIKASWTGHVGKTRHRIGIVLILTNAFTTYVMLVYAWAAFSTETADDPFPQIFGLSYAAQQDLLYWLFLTGEITFLLGIYVLGATWWGKFRSLFLWEGRQAESSST